MLTFTDRKFIALHIMETIHLSAKRASDIGLVLKQTLRTLTLRIVDEEEDAFLALSRAVNPGVRLDTLNICYDSVKTFNRARSSFGIAALFASTGCTELNMYLHNTGYGS